VHAQFRQTFIALILSTDMGAHFSMVSEFQNHSQTFDPELPADRLLLMKARPSSCAALSTEASPFLKHQRPSNPNCRQTGCRS
jgi:hypothetical protein